MLCQKEDLEQRDFVTVRITLKNKETAQCLCSQGVSRTARWQFIVNGRLRLRVPLTHPLHALPTSHLCFPLCRQALFPPSFIASTALADGRLADRSDSHKKWFYDINGR
jgi:hypothetical protein